MRLIDADTLSDKVFMANCGLPDCGRETCERCCIEPAMKFIEDAPTVDPLKHGHWDNKIIEFDVPHTVARCSNCKGKIWVYAENYEVKYPYCPLCGAKMDESVK